ncbi:4-fold beta flower protein [Methylobacterium soli]|uniref:4-fold beta flower domain-containing protein n=1 Tax=Methylobacterium soli TaxID=553447 RepID=A0A6L3SRS6_9HYPH|nr:hypothetical protein F6X53_30400 [Methylobacterium soli]
MIEFFDRAGAAAAYSPDDRSLFLWSGQPAAFIDDGKVYAYSGRFIGWVGNGWIVDDEGQHLLFEFDAVGGPVKPARTAKTVPGQRGRNPTKSTPQPTPVRPGPSPSPSWSLRAFADLI